MLPPRSKPWPRRKPSSRPYTRNWRLRSLSPLPDTHPHTLFPTSYVFSEDSIQRQLGYLDAGARVRRWFDGVLRGTAADDGNGVDVDATWLGGGASTQECCWHHCGSVEWVWCCGATCAVHNMTEEPAQEQTRDTWDQQIPPAAEEVEVQREMDAAARSMSSPAHTELSMPEPTELERDMGSGKVMLRRDEWECDFCGAECFCWTVGEDEDEEGGVAIEAEV